MTPETIQIPAAALPIPGAKEPYATVVEVTPTIAKEWWKRRRGTNRRLKNRNIQQYARDQRAGNWRLNNDSIAFDTEGFLQNGHHRLRACINTDTTFKTFVHWNVDPDSFITMDVHGKRSMADTLMLSGALHAKILGPGLIWCWRFANGKMLGDIDITYDDQKHLYEADKPRYDAAVESIAGLKLTGTLPVPLAFFGASVFRQHDQARSDAFFTSLATGAIGTDPYHPILQFRNLLTKSHQSRQYKLTAAEIIALMFKTWDAVIQGKTIKQLKAPRANELKKILMSAPLLYGQSAGNA